MSALSQYDGILAEQAPLHQSQRFHRTFYHIPLFGLYPAKICFLVVFPISMLTMALSCLPALSFHVLNLHSRTVISAD